MKLHFFDTLTWFATLILSLILSLCCHDLLAADSATKKPNAPAKRGVIDRYTTRVQSFRDQNQPYRNVVLVGDSITERFDVARWFPDRRVLNRGIGSDVIGNDLPPGEKRGLLNRMDESFFDCGARDIFLMIGINDLGNGHSPETIAAGYRQILERLKKETPRLKVHIESVLPMRGKDAVDNPSVLRINEHLQKLAKEFGYEYIDLHSQMRDEKGELKQEFTDDGVHLTDEGFKVWKRQIDKTLGW